MFVKTTLPIVAGLSVLGAMGGVWLGRSAISEIDPAYYTSPPTSFHADLAPNHTGDWAQLQAHEYQETGSTGGFGRGCFGCRTPPAEFYAAPPVTTYGDGWVSEAKVAAEPAPALVVEQAPDPERERVERYASYPVSAEEAEAPPVDAYASAELGIE